MLLPVYSQCCYKVIVGMHIISQNESGDIMLKDLASIIAGYADRKVVFELPDDVEKAGYSTATKARLAGSKIRKLGGKPEDIISGMES